MVWAPHLCKKVKVLDKGGGVVHVRSSMMHNHRNMVILSESKACPLKVEHVHPVELNSEPLIIEIHVRPTILVF